MKTQTTAGMAKSGSLGKQRFVEIPLCHLFIAALLTIGKTWKRPKCPSKINGLTDAGEKFMITKKERGEGVTLQFGD